VCNVEVLSNEYRRGVNARRHEEKLAYETKNKCNKFLVTLGLRPAVTSPREKVFFLSHNLGPLLHIGNSQEIKNNPFYGVIGAFTTYNPRVASIVLQEGEVWKLQSQLLRRT
jgi:hypothetical protein